MITYGKIEEKDLEQVIALYEQYLNSGEYIRQSIRRGFANKEYAGFKAECDGRLEGFISGRSGIDFTCPHPELEKEIRQLIGDREIYTADALLVLPGCRHQGVAQKLVSLMHQWLLDNHKELTLEEVWIYPDGVIPAEKPFSGIGARNIFRREIPMFYQNEDQYGISCPLCGEHCKCGALIEVTEVQ